jgi:hypothetical protein
MKQLIVFLLFLTGSAGAALAQQQQAASNPARVATDQLIEKYKLTNRQATRMYKIQVRKQETLAKIEPLKTSDPAKYRQKLGSLQKGTLGSIQLVLGSQQQHAIFLQTQSDVRVQRSKVRTDLQKSGAAPEAIEEAELALYVE